MAALLGLAVHAYCLRPRALSWPFFRLAGPGEPLFGVRGGFLLSLPVKQHLVLVNSDFDVPNRQTIQQGRLVHAFCQVFIFNQQYPMV